MQVRWWVGLAAAMLMSLVWCVTPAAHAMMVDYFRRAAEGRLSMTIDRRFPLAEAAAAHRYVEELRPAGRVLIIP